MALGIGAGASVARGASPGSVAFPEPRVVDRIKIIGHPYEPFTLVACDPAAAGSCDPNNPASAIRAAAKAFCQLYGTTDPPSGNNAGRRIGGRPEPYAADDPAVAPTYRAAAEGERWVIGFGQFNGLVGIQRPDRPTSVLSSVSCVPSLPAPPPPPPPPPPPYPAVRTRLPLTIEWTVPRRFEAGADGLLTYPSSPKDIAPDNYPVNLVVRPVGRPCRSSDRIAWTAPGVRRITRTGGCRFSPSSRRRERTA